MNRWKFIKIPPSSRNLEQHFLVHILHFYDNLSKIMIKSALKLIGSR